MLFLRDCFRLCDCRMTRLQELYAQHEAEFLAEQVVHSAHVQDPAALTPTQMLLKERAEHATEVEELRRELAELRGVSGNGSGGGRRR